MARVRVLLLDDDATIRFYVGLALAPLPVELVECDGVDEAVQSLRAAPCELLLLDLVLRQGSGFDLLQLLQHDPSLRQGARVAVVSAALGPEMRARLAPFGVWRLLDKPASIDALQACVRDALAAATPAPSSHTAGAAAPGRLNTDEQHALAQHFGGDLHLFEEFRDSCEAQFGDDLARIDEAFLKGDADGVHRVCHSLKTVLLMLGQPTLAAQARALDRAARATDRSAMQAQWPAFRRALAARIQPAAERPSAAGLSTGGAVQ